MKKYHCLYQIVNKINGMIYIGYHGTTNPFDSYMGSGKNIVAAHKEFGKENFIKYIIGLYNTKYEALKQESIIINREFVLKEDNYNIVRGGGGSSEEFLTEEIRQHYIDGVKKRPPVSKETKQKQKENLINLWNTEEYRQKQTKSLQNRKFSEEAKLNMSLSHQNISEETKQKMSDAQIKRHQEKPFTEEIIQKIAKSNIGQKRTSEQKNNMSKVSKQKWENEEYRQKCIESHIGYKVKEETKQKISNTLKGRKRDSEIGKKISESKKIKNVEKRQKKLQEEFNIF